MEEFCKLGIFKTTETLKNCLKVWTSHSEKVVLPAPEKAETVLLLLQFFTNKYLKLLRNNNRSVKIFCLLGK